MTHLELSGRVALVTGAARGIGLETARALHRRGARVAMVDLDESVVRASADRVAPEEHAIGIGADVSDRAAVDAAVAQAVQRWGRLDVVVANAGVALAPATALATPEEDFERVLSVNLLGVWRTVRSALPHVVEQQGNVTVVSSIYAFANGMGQLPYAMAKAGVEQLGRGLRTELSVRGVSTTVAYFGFIDTEMVHASLDRDPRAEMLVAAIPKPLRKRLPASIAGEGIAGAIAAGRATVMLPRRWRAVEALRGLNGVTDALALRAPRVQAILRDLDG